MTEDCPFAISSVFNATSWSGVTVMTIDGQDVVMPTYSTNYPGVYRDNIQFLNGYGSGEPYTFQAEFRSKMDALGFDENDFEVIIDSDDKVRIVNGDATVSIRLFANPDNRFWGFNVAGQNSAPSYGTDLVAPDDWAREVIKEDQDEVPPYMSFGIYVADALVGAFSIPEEGWIQSVPTHIRERGSVGDALDPAVDTFETVLHSLDPTFRVLVVDGHVAITVARATVVDLSDIVWVSESFRQRLGFSGRETTVARATGLDLYTIIADNPLPGFIQPQYPYINLNPMREHFGSTLRLMGGGIASVTTGNFLNWRLTFRLRGPQDQDGGIDELSHFMNSVAPYLLPGHPMVLFQDFPETRQRLFLKDISASQEPYDASFTSRDNGYHGAIVGRVHGDQDASWEPSWRGQFRQDTEELTLDIADTAR